MVRTLQPCRVATPLPISLGLVHQLLKLVWTVVGTGLPFLSRSQSVIGSLPLATVRYCSARGERDNGPLRTLLVETSLNVVPGALASILVANVFILVWMDFSQLRVHSPPGWGLQHGSRVIQGNDKPGTGAHTGPASTVAE